MSLLEIWSSATAGSSLCSTADIISPVSGEKYYFCDTKQHTTGIPTFYKQCFHHIIIKSSQTAHLCYPIIGNGGFIVLCEEEDKTESKKIGHKDINLFWPFARWNLLQCF